MKTDGTLKTSIGMLAITSVVRCEENDIGETEARKAGWESREGLLRELGKKTGDLFRVELRYVGEDPRIALRAEAPTGEELDSIVQRLERFDRASNHGEWTLKTLRAIREHPRLPAVKLAPKIGFEKDWLKIQVRKLKNLGLTVSHKEGYSLSIRGEAVLRQLKA